MYVPTQCLSSPVHPSHLIMGAGAKAKGKSAKEQAAVQARVRDVQALLDVSCNRAAFCLEDIATHAAAYPMTVFQVCMCVSVFTRVCMCMCAHVRMQAGFKRARQKWEHCHPPMLQEHWLKATLVRSHTGWKPHWLKATLVESHTS